MKTILGVCKNFGEPPDEIIKTQNFMITGVVVLPQTSQHRPRPFADAVSTRHGVIDG